MTTNSEVVAGGGDTGANTSASPLTFSQPVLSHFSFDTPVQLTYIQESAVNDLIRLRRFESFGLLAGSLLVAVSLGSQSALIEESRSLFFWSGVVIQLFSLSGGEFATHMHKRGLSTQKGGKRAVLHIEPNSTMDPRSAFDAGTAPGQPTRDSS